MPSLDELLKVRNKLKSSETVITSANGDVTFEKRNSDGSFAELREQDEASSSSTPGISNRRRKKVEYLKRCGFVIDLEPDLVVGEALSGLFFGSQDVAADLEILNSKNITHILNVGSGIPNHFPKIFQYLKVDITDLPETRILDYFDEIFPWIDDSRKNNGNVFVHCNAGISRSATITVAYMMKTEKMKLAKALEICKSQRNIRPNDGFAKQLREYESILGL